MKATDKTKAIAKSLGITFSPNISEETLQERIDAHKKEAQPEVVTKEPSTETQEKNTAKKAKKSNKKKKKQKVESKLDKKIKAKAAAKAKAKEEAKAKQEAAAYEKRVKEAEAKMALNSDADALAKKSQAQLAVKHRRKAIKKIRVIVTVNDPSRIKKQGEFFRARNSYSGPIGQMVLYDGKPQMLPNILINYLKEVPYQKFKELRRDDGTPYTKTSMGKAFTIQEVGQPTKEELEELAATQQAAGIFVE